MTLGMSVCGALHPPTDHLTETLLAFTQNAQNNEEYSSIADVGALLLIAGDPAGEDEPIRKGTAFQVCSCSVPTYRPNTYVSCFTDMATRV